MYIDYLWNPALHGNYTFSINYNPFKFLKRAQNTLRFLSLKIRGKSAKGFLSYDRKPIKQTDKQRLQLYRYFTLISQLTFFKL